MDNLNTIASFVFSFVTAIATIVTAITAVVAIKQTSNQIAQSNIQQLFDRRLEKYLIISELISNYKTYRTEVIDLKEDCSNALTVSRALINCTFFKEIRSNSRDNKDVNEQIYRLLGKLSTEAKLIWSGKEAMFISQFLLKYRDAIKSTDDYGVYWVNYGRSNIDNPIEDIKRKNEDINKHFKAKVDNSIKEIEWAYSQIIDADAENIILNQTSLLWGQKNGKSRKADK